MNWFDCIDAFIQVAEKQSFSAAGRSLNISSSAVTKRIQWLEHRLSQDLFIRTTRRVDLSEQGRAFIAKVRPLMEGWHELHREFIDDNQPVHGELVIGTLPVAAGLPQYVRIFQQLLAQYPKLKLRVVPVHQPLVLAEQSIDIFIGYDHYILDPANTVASNLHKRELQCYASPAYLAEFGQPKNYDELTQHNCIIFASDNVWNFDGEEILVSGNYRTESGLGFINACVEGLGIIYAPSFLLEEQVDQGLLESILSEYQGRQGHIKIYHTKYDYLPRKIHNAIQYLKHQLDYKPLNCSE